MSRLLMGLLLALVWSSANAHPLAPALLELRELGADRHDVLWRTSITRSLGADIAPELPAGCRETAAATFSSEERQSLVRRWQVQCGAGGFSGKTFAVSGLDRSPINVILRLEQQDGRVITALLDANAPSYTVPAPPAQAPVFVSYFGLGVEHLLLGLDHVLFVFGLVLLVRKRVGLLCWTVTAFTLGHSLTLALATLGLIAVNAAVMELGIALSILVLALELASGRPSVISRKPWLMAFAFGLLHGLGFAGALAEVGLPREAIPLALLAFNLGIEAAQLGLVLVLAPALALLERWARAPASSPSLARSLPVYCIGSLAAMWCFERAATLLSA